jgi:HEPN domain-containing protein
MNNNLKEAKRWISQAEADLKVAAWNFQGEFWWEVCFKCQQAAEKALKAYLYLKGERAILSHSLLELGKSCTKYEADFKKFEPVFRLLDKYYIITRYPNGLPGLTPSEYFEQDEAREAISSATKIAGLVKAKLKAA